MTFDSESAPDGASPARRIADSESPVAAGTARRVVDERTFSSAVGWTVLGTLIPGLGLWRSGRRVLGGLIMGAILVAIGGLAALYVTNQRMVQQAVITPDVLDVYKRQVECLEILEIEYGKGRGSESAV